MKKRTRIAIALMIATIVNKIHNLINKDKYSVKRNTLIVIALMTVTIIAGTFIINEAYKADRGYLTKWEANDMLIFFGTVLGGLATLLAVYVTIKDGDEKREKDKLDSENRQRRNFLSTILFDTLRRLDGSQLLDLKREIDRRYILLYQNKLIQEYMNIDELLESLNWSVLIIIANRNKNVEIYFSSDEETIFQDALDKIREYREKYTSLLRNLEHKYDDIMNEYNSHSNEHNPKYYFFMTIMNMIKKDDDFNQIKPLCDAEYKKLVKTVQDSLKEFEQRPV